MILSCLPLFHPTAQIYAWGCPTRTVSIQRHREEALCGYQSLHSNLALAKAWIGYWNSTEYHLGIWWPKLLLSDERSDQLRSWSDVWTWANIYIWYLFAASFLSSIAEQAQNLKLHISSAAYKTAMCLTLLSCLLPFIFGRTYQVILSRIDMTATLWYLPARTKWGQTRHKVLCQTTEARTTGIYLLVIAWTAKKTPQLIAEDVMILSAVWRVSYDLLWRRTQLFLSD